MNDAYRKLIGVLEQGGILNRFPCLADALWLACRRPAERERAEEDLPEPRMSDQEDAETPVVAPLVETPPKLQPPPRVPAEPPPLGIKPLRITLDAAESDELQAVVPDRRGTAQAPPGPAIHVPSPPSLPERDRFARQLKLLRRLHTSVRCRELNLDATLRRFCDEEIPEPVFSAGYERALNLTLLVDQSPTMDLWRNMACEFFGVLEASAAFRRCRALLWSIEIDDGRACASYSPLHSGVARNEPREDTADQASEIEFAARDVVFLFSDCTAQRWSRGDCLAELEGWAQRAHVVVVNPLPQHFWPRTSLERAERVNLHMDQVASPNASFRASSPTRTGVDPTLDRYVPMPIVAPDPGHMYAWTRFMALRRRSFPGRLFSVANSPPQPVDHGGKRFASRERLAMFKRQARPEAVELARLVAASPVINLPIVRLLRTEVLPKGRVGVEPDDCSYDAEVMLSPLLQVVPNIDAPEPDQVMYCFPDEDMRACLVAELPRSRIRDVFDTIGFYIEHEALPPDAGRFDGFVAMLRNPEHAIGDELYRVHEVVQVAARVIFRRLGGMYADLLTSQGQPRFLTELNVALGQVEAARSAGDLATALRILDDAYEAAASKNWQDAKPLLEEQLRFYRGLLRVPDLIPSGVVVREHFVEPTTGMALAPIAAGSFVMGSPDTEPERYEDEGPQHRVTLSYDFWIGICPVTQRQYEAVTGENPSAIRGPNRPVENVSWDDAVAYCERLTERGVKTSHRYGRYAFRLPTEAEWEYACRAGTMTRWSCGDDEDTLGRVAWYAGNSRETTHPVGAKEPNNWGLYDMHGNVWEWCLDAATLRGVSVETDTYVDGVVDPVCTDGVIRVYRGGSWRNAGDFCRSAARSASEAALRGVDVGFRVCLASCPMRSKP